MHAYNLVANLLYPPACLLCHSSIPSPSNPQMVCQSCRSAMPHNGPPACRLCGMELRGAFDAPLVCGRCQRLPLAFDRAAAPWRYDGVARDAVREFKYKRHWRLGRWLSEEMAAAAAAGLPLDEIGLIVPVPLHWLKRRLRGFNPAADLANTLAGRLGKPCLPAALRRTRWTRTQTRLAGARRFQNVRHAFSARPSLVRGRSILLIDDVLTSGATADACARALRAAGAQAVFVLTAARTPLS